MRFPINTSSTVSSAEVIDPGWARFRFSGDDPVHIVAPQSGYIYLVREIPSGLSEEREFVLVFIPESINPYRQHSFWHAPAPKGIIFRVEDLGDPLEFVRAVLLNVKQSGLQSIAIGISIPHEDQESQISDIENHPITTDSEIEQLSTYIIAEWNLGDETISDDLRDYLAIPVNEGLELLSFDASKNASFAYFHIGSRLVKNPFIHTIYFFDSLTYLKRFLAGGLFDEVPNFSSDFDYEGLEESFLHPFKINLVLPASFSITPPTAISSERVVFKGGTQDVEMCIPYDITPRTFFIPQIIIQVFRDSYADESLTSGGEPSDEMVILSGHIINPSIARTWEVNGEVLTVAEDGEFKIRWRHFTGSPVGNITIHVGDLFINFWVVEDPFNKAEQKLVELINLQNEITVIFNQELEDPHIDVKDLIYLYGLIRDLSHTFIEHNPRYHQLISSYVEKVNSITDKSGQLLRSFLRNNHVQYLLLFRPNTKRYDLFNSAILVLQGSVTGKNALNDFFNNFLAFDDTHALSYHDWLLNFVEKTINEANVFSDMMLDLFLSSVESDFRNFLSSGTRRQPGFSTVGVFQQRYQSTFENLGVHLEVTVATVNERETFTLTHSSESIGNRLVIFASLIFNLYKTYEFYNEGDRNLAASADWAADWADLAIQVLDHTYGTTILQNPSLRFFERLEYRTIGRFLWGAAIFVNVASTIIDCIQYGEEMGELQRRGRNRAANMLMVAMGFNILGLIGSFVLLTSPVVGAAIIFIAITLELCFSSPLGEPRGLYPPRLSYFLATSLLGAESTASTDWRLNINKQIAIALSYSYPLEITGSSGTQPVYRHETNELNFRFSFVSFSAIVFFRVLLFDENGQFLDFMVLQQDLSNTLSLNGRQLSEELGTIDFNIDSSGYVHNQKIDAEIVWVPSSSVINVHLIQRVRVIASLTDFELYTQPGPLTQDQIVARLKEAKYTTIAEAIVNSSIPV